MDTMIDFRELYKGFIDQGYFLYRRKVVKACETKWKALEPEDLPMILAQPPTKLEDIGILKNEADIMIRCAARAYLEGSIKP